MDEHLVSVLATLEQSRDVLANSGNTETAHLLSLAILDLRMKLNRITDVELKALCDEVSLADATSDKTGDQKSPPRRRPLLRLVK